MRTTTQFVGPLSVVDTVRRPRRGQSREAVSNAVRHGRTRTLAVTVRVDDDR